MQPSPRAPVISFQLWVRVGSAFENPDEAGISHVLEHMLFKGTKKRPVGRIAQEVEGSGGEINAYTSFDETVYYITIPSRYGETALDILSDVIANSMIDADELTREKEVIVEEISRGEDSPNRTASEKLFEIAYRVHPYGRPIIGTRESVRSFSREFILDFVRRWYVPENMALIMAGGLDPDKMLAAVEKRFGGLPARSIQRPVFQPEPPLTEPRVLLHRMESKAGYGQIGIPIPRATDPMTPKLDLLGHILGGGASSRLELDLKSEKNLVNSIYASTYAACEPGVFNLGWTSNSKQTVEVVRQLGCHIARLTREPPSVEELAKAKLALKADRVYELESASAIARKLGYFHCTAGGLEREEDYYRAIDNATAEELLEIAKRTIDPHQASTAIVLPLEEMKNLHEAEIKNAWLEGSASKPSSKPKRQTEDYECRRLPNGIDLLIKQDRSVPIVALRALMPAGVRYESPQHNGISHLAASLLTKGTDRLDANAIAHQSDSLAGGVEGIVGQNSLGVRASFIAEKLLDGTQLFTDLLTHAAFPDDELKKEKLQQLEAIHQQEDNLASVAFRQFRETLFRQHPYRLSLLGRPESVRGLNQKQVANFYRDLLKKEKMVLSAVGSFDPDRLADLLSEGIAGHGARSAKGRQFSAESSPQAPRIKTSKHPAHQQAHIVLGFLGTTINHPDRFALDVLSTVLGGQGGRLFVELRDREALAYSVSASSQEGIEPGSFTVYMGVDATKVDPAVSGMLRILKQLVAEPPSEEELTRARRYLIGSYEIDLQRGSNIAAALASNHLYGLPLDTIAKYPQQIEAVTRDALFAATKKYLRLDAYILSVVHP